MTGGESSPAGEAVVTKGTGRVSGRFRDRRDPEAALAASEAAGNLVFGRTEYAEPLVELGATGDDDVLGAFPGEWVELVSFPEECVVWIVRGGQAAEE